MAYRDRAIQRDYQRRWIAARRQAYLASKSCVGCGATEGLEINHVRPLRWEAPRPNRHRVFSYTAVKREAELALVEPRCRSCHYQEGLRTGVFNTAAKLSPADVREIRALEHSVSAAALAKRFGVRPEAIRKVWARETWRVLPDVEFENTTLRSAA